MKKIIILVFLLTLPIIFAGVTRIIPKLEWICPSGFDVKLEDGGAINSYGAEETLDETWTITYSSHPYILQNPYQGKKKILFAGINKNDKITYSLVVPTGTGYSISGIYVLDTGSERLIGTTNFVVHEYTCNSGTEDDLDGDSCGKGCKCTCSDCCDKQGDPGLGCSTANAPNMHPGAVEDNTAGENDGIDQDCNGCDFVDLDNDGYRKLGTGCGANDCDDRLNGADGIAGNADDGKNIHPGATEIPWNNIDEDCAGGNNCGNVNGDCQYEKNDKSKISYYDQNCDCKVDDNKKNEFIINWLAGIIDPALQLVTDNIPGSGYKNP